MILITLILFLFPNTLSFPIDKVTCTRDRNVVDSINESEMVSTLMRWCASDSMCSYGYRLDQGSVPNATIFNYLARKALSQFPSIDAPLESLVCESENDKMEITRKLWVLLLIQQRRFGLVCDDNHELIVNSDGVTTSCACSVNSTCNDDNFDLIFFYIFISLVAVVAVLIVIVEIKRMKIEIQHLDKPVINTQQAISYIKLQKDLTPSELKQLSDFLSRSQKK